VPEPIRIRAISILGSLCRSTRIGTRCERRSRSSTEPLPPTRLGHRGFAAARRAGPSSSSPPRKAPRRTGRPSRRLRPRRLARRRRTRLNPPQSILCFALLAPSPAGTTSEPSDPHLSLGNTSSDSSGAPSDSAKPVAGLSKPLERQQLSLRVGKVSGSETVDNPGPIKHRGVAEWNQEQPTGEDVPVLGPEGSESTRSFTQPRKKIFKDCLLLFRRD
jgi:hypothetical protein